MAFTDILIGIGIYAIVALAVIGVLPGSWLSNTTVNRKTRPVLAVACGACVLACVGSMELNPTWTEGQLLWTNQYELMADALLKGQLHLDLPVSPELAEMSNPYDYRMRKLLDVDCYWDHAYYDGHYYMYFGVVPAVLVFAPFKLLFGTSLPAYHATQLFVALYIVGQFAIFGRLRHHLFPTMRLGACLTLSVAFALMSVWFACAHPALYCTAITSALCTEIWSIYFFTRALLATKRTASQAAMLAAGALLGALAFGCRPPIALANVIVVPVFVTLARRYGASRRLAASTIALVLPYVFVGCLLMLYNWARFDSPFEFGQSYQLTFYDQSDYGVRAIDPAAALDGVLMFLFKPPFARGVFGGLLTNFPIIVVSLLALASEPVRSALQARQLGRFLATAAVAILLIAIIESVWSPAILERYRMDAYWLCGLCAFVLFGLWGRSVRSKARYSFLVSLAAIATALTAIAFFFVPHDYSITASMPELLPHLASCLTFGLL